MIDSGEGLLRELTAHADADIAVFEDYMAALKLPRGTDEEKEVRRAALAGAAMAATEMPLNAAQSTLECLDLARQAAHVAHTGIVSDVAAGAALLHGALTGVLYNVDINLKSIKDANAASEYRTSRDHLREAAAARHGDIVTTIAERLA
jgi:formiminotetrahydrofolate cyclodeaminase